MLEKDSWSHTPDGAFFVASCDNDSVKEKTNIASDDTRMPNHWYKGVDIDPMGSEFCANDPILCDGSAAVDSYPLSPISQTENDLGFFENDHEDKESSDLLYFGWPDIGNFEDVDRMFSCDSTFGLGGVANEDELGWFSLSDAIEGSEHASKSGFKFSSLESSALKNISDNHDPSKLHNASSSVKDSSTKTASVSYNTGSWTLEGDGPAKDEFMLKDEGTEFNSGVQFKNSTINRSENDNNGTINWHKKQSKHQNQSEGKRKEQCLENGGSFHHIGDLQTQDVKLLSGDMSNQVFTSIGTRQQDQDLGPSAFSYSQSHVPYVHLDCGHPSDQATVTPTLSGMRSENSGLSSLSPKESSYASNQVLSFESSRDPMFEATSTTLNQKRESLHCQIYKHGDLEAQVSIHHPVSVPKQVHCSESEYESRSDVEGASRGIPPELDSSNVQESFSMSSGLDEISLEATSFRQLQLVMEQLDLRSKLCIRDSLYRLARSAEQRHNYANLSHSCGDDRDGRGAFMAEGLNKCTGFMGIETDTNPIDRSIAHLLFHRPSNASVMPAHDDSSLRSHAMEEGAAGTDRSVADHRRI